MLMSCQYGSTSEWKNDVCHAEKGWNREPWAPSVCVCVWKMNGIHEYQYYYIIHVHIYRRERIKPIHVGALHNLITRSQSHNVTHNNNNPYIIMIFILWVGDGNERKVSEMECDSKCR